MSSAIIINYHRIGHNILFDIFRKSCVAFYCCRRRHLVSLSFWHVCVFVWVGANSCVYVIWILVSLRRRYKIIQSSATGCWAKSTTANENWSMCLCITSGEKHENDLCSLAQFESMVNSRFCACASVRSHYYLYYLPAFLSHSLPMCIDYSNEWKIRFMLLINLRKKKIRWYWN